MTPSRKTKSAIITKIPSWAKIIAALTAGMFVKALTEGKPSEPKLDRQTSNADHPEASLENLPEAGWFDILKRTYAEIDSDRVLAVAAGVTFYGLLALFPAITMFVSLYGLFADRATVGEHISMLSSLLPQGALGIITDQVKRIVDGGGATLSFAFISGLMLAAWSANAGMKAIIEALNIAYGVRESRSFFRLNVQSFVMTASGLATLILLIGAVAVIPAILAFLQLGALADWLLWAGRWPVVLVILILGLAALYRYGPDRPNTHWHWITPGSLVASFALLLFSMLFSWYAANFGSYNETYGSLGAVIGFMTWIWLSAVIVLVGAELNAEVENTVQAKS